MKSSSPTLLQIQKRYTAMKLLLHLLSILCPLVLAAQSDKTLAYAARYDFIPITDTAASTFGGPYEFLLLHADGESRFHASSRQFNDSMSLAYQSAHPQYAQPRTQEEAQEAANHFTAHMQAWKKSVAVDYIVRKDFATGTFQNVLPTAFPPQHLEEPLALQWHLGTGQDTLLGMLCHDAHTTYGGRRYTAWFAPSIPIPDGPYVFSGLPGLIVRVSDEQGWFHFLLRDVSTTPGQRFWKADYLNPQSKAISRKQFVAHCARLKSNPRMPSGIEVPEAKILDMKERSKSKYFLLLESE